MISKEGLKQPKGATDLLLEKIRETDILTDEEMRKVEANKQVLNKLSIQLFRHNVRLGENEYGDPIDQTANEVAMTLAVSAIGSAFPHYFFQTVDLLTGECLNARGIEHTT